MHYLAILLLVVNIAFFGYHFMFRPLEANPNADASQAAAEEHTLKLVSEVAPGALTPREDN